MKFLKITKILQSKYITRYDIDYETSDGHIKTYEMISRDPNITNFEQLHNNEPEAVVMIMFNNEKNKILLNKEFRLAMGDWIYSFPAGLIDPGENVEEAARRELMEETGLQIEKIDSILDKNYSAMGFSNEKNICLIGVAGGKFQPSTSSEEEIIAGWYDKEQIRTLLKSAYFSARAQGFCYLWANT